MSGARSAPIRTTPTKRLHITTDDLVRASAASAVRRHRRGGARLLLRDALARGAGDAASAATSPPRARPVCPWSSTARAADDDMRANPRGGNRAGRLPLRSALLHRRPELARRGLALGGYISFSGIITFKNAEEIREVARIRPGRPHSGRNRRAVSRAGAASRQVQRAGLRASHGRKAGRSRAACRSTRLPRQTTEQFLPAVHKTVPRLDAAA